MLNRWPSIYEFTIVIFLDLDNPLLPTSPSSPVKTPGFEGESGAEEGGVLEGGRGLGWGNGGRVSPVALA